MEELTDAEHGSRFPSMVDKLNRPIKGKDVIYVRNHSTFMPNEELYDKTSVKPPMPMPGAPDILRQALTEERIEASSSPSWMLHLLFRRKRAESWREIRLSLVDCCR